MTETAATGNVNSSNLKTQLAATNAKKKVEDTVTSGYENMLKISEDLTKLAMLTGREQQGPVV